MEFEWNPDKAASNLRKHGISFDDAADAIRRDFSLVEVVDLDSDPSEERVKAYAMLDGVVLTIIFTMRGDVCRLISARRADKHEQDTYYRENHY
jgi:uncharacterized protein